MKYCSKCGHQCSDEIKFCKSCGRPFAIVGLKEMKNQEIELPISEIPFSEIPVDEELNSSLIEQETLGNVNPITESSFENHVEDSVEMSVLLEDTLAMKNLETVSTDEKNLEIENDDIQSQIAQLQGKEGARMKVNASKTLIKKEKRIISKKSKVISIIAFLVLLIISTLFIFRNNIKQIIGNSAEANNIEMVSPNYNNVKTESNTENVALPTQEKNINSNVEKTDVVTPSKNISEKDQTETFVKPTNKRKATVLPELKTVSEYFTYLADDKIPYNDKTIAKNQLIQNHFTTKNFKVNIQGENGYITGQVTIDDLSEELLLINTPIKIVSIKRPMGLMITELTISYK